MTEKTGRRTCLLFEPLGGVKARKHAFDFTYEIKMLETIEGIKEQ